MNISYNWLKELIGIDLGPNELSGQLTRVGLAVEGVHQHGDDFVLDIDLTSNRPDCLSHLGVAREIGVITGKALKADTQSHRASSPEIPVPAILAGDTVRIEEPDLCHRFTARIIRNVKIGPSPEWLVRRLEAIGERAINNVADITNYVMHELGQPMHSFDLDKLAENRIIVRRARPGEKITTLDEIDRKPDTSMLMICDAEKPVAVAGVMGGLDSGISDTTSNVLLEVAYFKRDSVRQTSRKLGLATEASYRFERGVDIENLKRASDRASSLMCELAGGELGEFVDVFPTRYPAKEIESRDISWAVKRLTGLEVRREECVRILNALGIASKGNGPIFIAPSWRHDISIEEDLVEEVARQVGYENIADELPPAFGAGEYQQTEPQEALIRRSLVDQGFDEAISYSFIDRGSDGSFDTVAGLVDPGQDEPYVTLQDSVIEGAVRMRPTLLAGLLDAVRLNFNYQRKDIKLFEIGKAFAARTSEDNLPVERELFAIAVTGGEMIEHRSMAVRELDFYDAKGSLETAVEAAGFKDLKFEPGDYRHLRRGQSATVRFRGSVIGSVGRLNEEIAVNYKFKQPVYVAEIDLQAVLQSEPEPIIYQTLPKYPAVVRDVSFTVSRDVGFASVCETIMNEGFELCRRVSFVDLYEGKGLADDQRSLTLRLEYRSDDRTLLDAEVDSVHNELVAKVEAELGIQRRV